MENKGIFSIGHSNHSIDVFISLLKQYRIDVIADVRSLPFSKFNPQFNRENLSNTLNNDGIKYIFFGKELGARSDDSNCYVNGKVKYSKLALKKKFKDTISLLLEYALDIRIALMCAEKEHLDCHRSILVSQELLKHDCEVQHIHADGSIEPHTESLERLIDVTGIPKTDLFKSKDELFYEALKKQESRIAYKK